MERKIVCFLTAVIVFASMAFSALSAEPTVPKDEKKLTTLGKYVTSAEAYEMWKAAPDKVKIIDCRTPEEYVFVGHAPMAYNVPSMLWTDKWNEEKKNYDMKDNPDFETRMKEISPPDGVIMIMCRSGHRSAASVNRLANAGFTNVYSIIDGFEGDKIAEEDSFFKGKRLKNGWRNSIDPWTYDLDPKLVYAPGK
ncbi:MAG: rhodanese-like domain-containing protein [Syntrophobacteraceae bacterium]